MDQFHQHLHEQIDEMHNGHHHHDHSHAHHSLFCLHTFFEAISNPDCLQVLFITSLIGLLPILCVFLMPSKKGGNLDIPLAFAAGGLLGDALLHLIPHAIAEAMGNHHHDHNHDHDEHSHTHEGHSHGPESEILQYCLLGLVVFWIMERFLDSFVGHSHEHTHNNIYKKTDGDHKDVKEGKIRMSTIVLNMTADLAHNFTDGLAIGASFATNRALGYQTALAVFIHEIPHEIGDYAILIESGTSRSRAAVYQALTAIGAIVGCYIGFLGKLYFENSWVLPFTAGGFVYIACASVMPALSRVSNLKNLFQCIALLTGIGLMKLVQELEEYLE